MTSKIMSRQNQNHQFVLAMLFHILKDFYFGDYPYLGQ